MKRLHNLAYIGLVLAFLCVPLISQAQIDAPRGSQMATVSQTVGISKIYINYSLIHAILFTVRMTKFPILRNPKRPMQTILKELNTIARCNVKATNYMTSQETAPFVAWI